MWGLPCKVVTPLHFANAAALGNGLAQRVIISSAVSKKVVGGSQHHQNMKSTLTTWMTLLSVTVVMVGFTPRVILLFHGLHHLPQPKDGLHNRKFGLEFGVTFDFE